MANSLEVPFETAKLKVPVQLMPWPIHCAERVGVNSFGIGGANAHVGPKKLIIFFFLQFMLKLIYRFFLSPLGQKDLTHQL